MPTISQLQYIITVDRLRHFGKAAEQCHISQPSLSQQIQKVEEEVGITLFDRLKKPIIPTEKGKRFIEQAKIVLHEHQQLLHMAHEESHQIKGNLHIGLIPTIAPYLIPLFIKYFHEHFPLIQLKIDEYKTQDMIQFIRHDQLDVGILATGFEETTLFMKTLYIEPFYIYINQHHQLQKKQIIKEQDIDQKDVWLLKDGHCFRDQVMKICHMTSDNTVYPHIQFEGGQLETLQYLVRQEKGLTLVPELFTYHLSPEDKKKHLRPFAPPIPHREVGLIYRRQHWKKDLIKALEESILMSIPKELKDLKKQRSKKMVKIGEIT